MASLASLEAHAEPEAVDLARRILEHSASSRAWTSQVGPALTQSDTARLLRKTTQAVCKDRRLLKVVNSDGRPVYPIVQFDGRSQVDGVDQVVALLGALLEPLGVAGWLTSKSRELGARPIDCLRAGEVEPVVELARAVSRRLA